MMNTRRTKLSMVRDDSQSSKTSNKKCPVVLHGDHMHVYAGFMQGLCRVYAGSCADILLYNAGVSAGFTTINAGFTYLLSKRFFHP